MVANEASADVLLSLRVDIQDLQDETERFVPMKLFLTYNLEKVTNALIAFKSIANKHWLSKTALLLGDDIKLTRKMLFQRRKDQQPVVIIPIEEKKVQKRRRTSEGNSRDDSMALLKSGEVEGDMSFTAQELDDLVRSTHLNAASGLREDSLMVNSILSAPKSPVKSRFASDKEDAA